MSETGDQPDYSVLEGRAHPAAALKETRRSDGFVVSTSTYVGNVKHGPYKGFCDNGTVLEEGGYGFGLKAGAWKQYTCDGALLFERFYVFGKQHGTTVQHGPGSGPRKNERVVVARTSFRFGVEDGEAEEFWSNGQPSKRGSFRRGRRHGTWVYFDTAGKENGQKVFHCGKPVSGPGESAPLCDDERDATLSLNPPKWIAPAVEDGLLSMSSEHWDRKTLGLALNACRSGGYRTLRYGGKEHSCRALPPVRPPGTVGGTRG